MDSSAWRFSVAPMIDVTDRHCRFFHRLLAPQVRLYTEMITTGALLHGDQARHLDFNQAEHPLAIQLGGNSPKDLAFSAKLAESWGYDEINLNCGCPSDRVQSGAFGACLMLDSALVADCIKSMQDVVSVPVTVKHRLGIDYDYSYGFVRDFVGTIYDTGCHVFIVHARNAVLKGLSPKENREKPPLRYDYAQSLKQDFPDAQIILNGGLKDFSECLQWATNLDGIMLGRAAWHNPQILSDLNRAFYPEQTVLDSEQVFAKYLDYIIEQQQLGVPLHILLRGLLGWHSGRAGARQWRRLLSDNKSLKENGISVIEQAWASLNIGLA